jgi:hypothetical protein
MKRFPDHLNDHDDASSASADMFTDEPPPPHPLHHHHDDSSMMMTTPIAAQVARDDAEELSIAPSQQQLVQKPSRKNLLLLIAVGVLAIVLIVTLTGSWSSLSPQSQPVAIPSLQKQHPQRGTLRPVETPPPKIPSQEDNNNNNNNWNQRLGGDLLGSNLGGAFGKFVTLSSDGTRLAVTSTAAERTSISLFQLLEYDDDEDDGDSLYERNDMEGYFVGGQSPYYATVSGDGNYFVVAATYDDDDGSDNTNTLTHQVQFLDFSGQASQPVLYLSGLYDVYYGRPVAISHSANYVAVGIDGWQTGGKSLVQIYTINDSGDGDGWKQVGSDIVGDGGFGEFGNTVCISADGDIVAVADRSKFRVFENIGGGSGDWTQMGGTEADSHSAGVKRIALSSDGKTIAASGDGIRVYRFDEGTKKWVQLGNTIEADNTDYQYYNLDRVALSGDGLTLATGTDNADSADAWEHVVGYVRVYRLLDGQWRKIGERIDGAKSSEAFGSSLSLTADGSRLAVAAPGNEEYSATVGVVRVYDYLA